MDQNGWNEIIVGAGPDPNAGSPLKGYQYVTGEGMMPLFTRDAFPSGYTHGVCVAAGRL